MNPASQEMEKCFICGFDLKLKCPECTECADQPRELCDLAQGRYGCVFHFHCISIHLKTNQNCPIHKTEWGYIRYFPRGKIEEVTAAR